MLELLIGALRKVDHAEVIHPTDSTYKALMNPNALFLHRYDRLASLIGSAKEADHLDMAALMRQLLLDKHSLADTVNKNSIKLQFEIGFLTDPRPDLPQPIMEFLIDAIDPYCISGEREKDTVTLSRDELPKHAIARVQGTPITIKDLVKYASNVAGGVHHDPRNTHDYKVIAAINARMKFNGISFLTRQLKPIAKVVLRGLDPLVMEVKSRRVSRPPSSPGKPGPQGQ